MSSATTRTHAHRYAGGRRRTWRAARNHAIDSGGGQAHCSAARLGVGDNEVVPLAVGQRVKLGIALDLQQGPEVVSEEHQLTQAPVENRSGSPACAQDSSASCVTHAK